MGQNSVLGVRSRCHLRSFPLSLLTYLRLARRPRSVAALAIASRAVRFVRIDGIAECRQFRRDIHCRKDIARRICCCRVSVIPSISVVD
jgi:hypothetical protein